MFYYKELDDGHEYAENIGIFSTRDRANFVAKKLMDLMEIRENSESEGVHIEPYQVNKEHWNEGYVTVDV